MQFKLIRKYVGHIQGQVCIDKHTAQENRIDDAGFIDLVFAKNDKTKNTAFWSALSAFSAAS